MDLSGLTNLPKVILWMLSGVFIFVLLIQGVSVSKAEVPLPGDSDPIYSSPWRAPSLPQSESNILFRLYKNHSDKKSIHRCPFRISCSNYAKSAIESHGIFAGSLLTIDRYFYRENIAAQYNYEHISYEGRILLDDSYFLEKREE
ncbi:membrane protein insertion efficiency factor YidD [bacterium]|nr:membrane protein insertion efficiency factor YidD [bacterium]